MKYSEFLYGQMLHLLDSGPVAPPLVPGHHLGTTSHVSPLILEHLLVVGLWTGTSLTPPTANLLQDLPTSHALSRLLSQRQKHAFSVSSATYTSVLFPVALGL